jgi:hypothetical protein
LLAQKAAGGEMNDEDFPLWSATSENIQKLFDEVRKLNERFDNLQLRAELKRPENEKKERQVKIVMAVLIILQVAFGAWIFFGN